MPGQQDNHVPEQPARATPIADAIDKLRKMHEQREVQQLELLNRSVLHRVRQEQQKYLTKDSGKREDFETGARRDVQDDKPLYECIPVFALERVALLYTRGAKKYGLDNWKKGIPFMRMMASLLRHAFQFVQGDASEDHLAAVCWNALGIMYYEWAIEQGKLPASLDDRELPVKMPSREELIASIRSNTTLEPVPDPIAPVCPGTGRACGLVPPCISIALCKTNTEPEANGAKL